jgi:hypothetical protein
MGSTSIWHWIVVLFLGFVWIFPFWKILPRAGISKWFSLVAIFPLFGLILLWVIALRSWPNRAAV